MKWGVVGFGAVVIGGTALALRRTVLREAPAAGLKVFTVREYSVLAALGDRICPATEDGLPNASGFQVAAGLDADFASADPEMREAIQLIVGLFESGLTGALFAERVTPFSQLDSVGQDRVLCAWRDSRVPFRRQVFMAFKGLLASGYYGHQETWARAGYPGPPSPRVLRAAFADNLVDYEALRAKRG